MSNYTVKLFMGKEDTYHFLTDSRQGSQAIRAESGSTCLLRQRSLFSPLHPEPPSPPPPELGRRLVDGKNEDAGHFHTFTLALKGKMFSPVHILSLTLPSQDIWLLTLQSV